MSRLRDYFEQRRSAIMALLQEMVEIESPSHVKSAVDRMGDRVAELMQTVGGTVERFPRQGVGGAVLGRWASANHGKPILLLCHMDTVWEIGTLTARPPRWDGDRYYAPGAYDMKSGLAIALSVLQGLQELRIPSSAPVWLLCNGDEEIGSPGSRQLIEELAADSSLVLCLEPALPGGTLKTERKGVGICTVSVRGRSSHAGGAHELGVNAIEEMAHQIMALQSITDYGKGTTVSVGTIAGGTASNVVPAHCEIKVDFRAASHAEVERVMTALHGLRPRLQGAELKVGGGLNRPPMVRDATMMRTFGQARRDWSAPWAGAVRRGHWRRLGRQLYGRLGRAHARWTGAGRGRRALDRRAYPSW